MYTRSYLIYVIAHAHLINETTNDHDPQRLSRTALSGVISAIAGVRLCPWPLPGADAPLPSAEPLWRRSTHSGVSQPRPPPFKARAPFSGVRPEDKKAALIARFAGQKAPCQEAPCQEAPCAAQSPCAAGPTTRAQTLLALKPPCATPVAPVQLRPRTKEVLYATPRVGMAEQR